MGVGMWEPNKKEDLAFLAELLEAGKVVPVIDRRYPLHEVPEAFRYLEGGHHQGKVVITVERERAKLTPTEWSVANETSTGTVFISPQKH